MDSILFHVWEEKISQEVLLEKGSGDRENFLIQEMKDLGDTASTTMGINLWFTPQISEHWP